MIGNSHARVIKGVLSEELDSSRHKLEVYRKALADLRKGSIVPKRIKGQLFHYLAYRKGSRMVFEYQGRLDEKELAKFQEIQKQRAQYRSFVADLRKQILFLERALHERKRRKTSSS